MRGSPVIRQKKIYFTVLLLLTYILLNFYLLPSTQLPPPSSYMGLPLTPNVYLVEGKNDKIEYVERETEGLANGNNNSQNKKVEGVEEEEEGNQQEDIDAITGKSNLTNNHHHHHPLHLLFLLRKEIDKGELEETPITKETVPSITFVQPVLPKIQLPSETQHNPFTHTEDPVTAITTGASSIFANEQQKEDEDGVNQKIESIEITKTQRVLFFMAIISSPDRFGSRQKLRDYWLQGKVGNATLQDDGKRSVDYAFYIGRAKNNIEEKLAQEQERYGDLVFLDFTDTYSNLTLKTRLIFKHAYDNFNWKYLAKVDDDIFLCYDGMTKFLNALPFSDDVYLGTLNWGATPVRDKGHHWFISRDQWPEDTYPPYALGPFYIMSSEIAKYLGEDPSVFPFEDTSVILSLRERGQPIHAIHISSLQIEIKNIACAPALWTHRTLDTMDHWSDCCDQLLWKRTEFSIHTFSWDDQKKFHQYRDESAEKSMQFWTE